MAKVRQGQSTRVDDLWVSESPVLIVAGVVVLLIAFACAVAALVRREERRGMNDAARAEAKRARAERARRRQTRAKPGGMQPPAAEDPALILHLRDYTEPG